MDLADDRFDVRYDRSRIEERAVLEIVRTLGYQPELVQGSPGPRPELERVDLSLLPGDLQELFARARAARTPILLEFFAPG